MKNLGGKTVTDRQTYRQTDRRTDKQTDRQTDRRRRSDLLASPLLTAGDTKLIINDHSCKILFVIFHKYLLVNLTLSFIL